MNIKIIFSLIIFLFASKIFNAHAQISIADYPEIEKVKTGTTYIVVNDPNSEQNKKYIEIFKKYWTISNKVEFIAKTEMAKYLSKENSFFTVDAQLLQSNNSGIGNSVLTFYLHLWVVKDSYFDNKKRSAFSNTDRKKLARVALYADRKYSDKAMKNNDLDGHMDYSIGYDFDFEDQIFNWSPGILKNYLQLIAEHIKLGKRHNFVTNFSNKIELEELKKGVLYVPDYILLKEATTSNGRRNSDKEVFESYPYRYTILHNQELSKAILDEKKIFYLLFVLTEQDIFVSVTNSLTGEIIYSKDYSLINGFPFKSKHLKHMLEEKN